MRLSRGWIGYLIQISRFGSETSMALQMQRHRDEKDFRRIRNFLHAKAPLDDRADEDDALRGKVLSRRGFEAYMSDHAKEHNRRRPTGATHRSVSSNAGSRRPGGSGSPTLGPKPRLARAPCRG